MTDQSKRPFIGVMNEHGLLEAQPMPDCALFDAEGNRRIFIKEDENGGGRFVISGLSGSVVKFAQVL